MPAVVGIDFGTSNSAVSAHFGGKNQVIPDENGNRLTPSVVAFGKNSQILIGGDAKNQGFKNPKRTVHSIKRLIGRKSYSEEIEKSQVLLPYELIEIEGQNVAVKIGDQTYRPQEVAAMILRHMKEVAESGLGDTVNECVVTVPAYFNDSQRQSTKEACEIAGLQVLRVINEPTAAALAYGFGKKLDETVVIYDLGGGTFDISILKLKDKVFEVVATAGDTFLGGDDFDDRIMDIIAEDFLKKWNTDLRSVPEALPLLRSNAEKTKRRLSYAERSDIYIPGIVQKDGKSIDLHFTLSRDQLKENTRDLIQKTFKVCDEALNSASLSARDIDAVVLVGGPTKMPLIYEAVSDYFGKTPLNELNPDEVVSIGASIQADSLVSKGSDKKALLLDVTPLDLGVETVDGYVETLIEKNSPIPTDCKKVFTTTKDNQKSVDVRVYQGKGRRIESSHLLGEFSLSGFPTGKAGQASIEVEFNINTDGIVEVSATDKESGSSQSIQVRLSAAMGTESVSKSAEKAKDYQEVRLKNELDGASKVLMFFPSPSGIGSSYQEGYVRDFNPLSEKFTVVPDMRTGKEEEVERKRLGWVAVIEDFSNIPRYISALCVKPESFENALESKFFEFKLDNGQILYAQSETGKPEGEGLWVKPYFSRDSLPGKVFIYASRLDSVEPVEVTANIN